MMNMICPLLKLDASKCLAQEIYGRCDTIMKENERCKHLKTKVFEGMIGAFGLKEFDESLKAYASESKIANSEGGQMNE